MLLKSIKGSKIQREIYEWNEEKDDYRKYLGMASFCKPKMQNANEEMEESFIPYTLKQ